MIGRCRSREVGKMRFTPARPLARILHRDGIGGMMEPFMPSRRHTASFFFTVIHDPALFTTVIGAAPSVTAATTVIAVSRLVATNQFTENPSVKNGTCNHGITSKQPVCLTQHRPRERHTRLRFLSRNMTPAPRHVQPHRCGGKTQTKIPILPQIVIFFFPDTKSCCLGPFLCG